MPKEFEKITDKELEIALARNSYSFYVEYAHTGIYQPARHTEAICQELRLVESGETERLMIFVPPRHSKSMTVTETFPSYFIGKDPERRVIAASYSDFLARRFGRANRRKLEEYGQELFGIKIPYGGSSVTNWGIEGRRGGMLSTGIGGSITGEGADLLLIDDPIKNQQEAQSVTYRERLWDEWQNTLLTRLQPGGAVIIIMTRWHEDDLAGRLQAAEPDRWRVLVLPAEAEDDDPLGRANGELLWPEYGFDRAWADNKKREVGSHTWNALYQQRPAPESGEVLKKHWWKFWCHPGQQLQSINIRLPDGEFATVAPRTIPAQLESLSMSWDMSFTDKSGSSYVVGQVWGKLGPDKFLLDQVRERMDFPATLSAFRTMVNKWPQTGARWVESKANGPAVIDTLKRDISGLIPVEPEGSKLARAYAVSPQIEAGNVYLPHPQVAPWVWDFIDECATFPNSANDDQVDAMTQALTGLQTSSFVFV